MDIKIKRGALLKALEKCAHPSGIKDDPREYAGRVLITVRENDKTANFYSVDTYLCVDTAVLLEECTSGGRVAVDTKRLQLMVNNLPDEVVHLDLHENKLVVTGSHKRRYTAPTFDTTLFPPLNEPDKEAPSITLPGPKLAYLLRRVDHSCEDNKTRPHLSGIKLHADVPEGSQLQKMTAVTTDGYKLCVVTHWIMIKGTLPFAAFLPFKLLKLLQPTLEHEESVTLIMDKHHIFVTTEDSLFGALLPREGFIDWANAVNTMNPMEPLCSIPAVAVIEALRAISAVKTSHNACVRFHLEKDALYLDLRQDPSDASDVIPVKNQNNRSSYTFYADPKFVIDHLKGADTDCELRETNMQTLALCTTDGYLGILVPRDANAVENHESKAKDSKPKEDAKKSGPGPGRGGKKKTSKKTSSKKKPPPEPESASEEEEEDDLGSADPSQYMKG